MDAVNVNLFATGQVIAGVACLTWLAWTIVMRPSQFVPAACVGVLLAITVVQPFGVRADAVKRRPSDVPQVGPDGTHHSGLFRFHIHAQHRNTSDTSRA